MINHYVLNFSNYTPYHILPTKSLKSWLFSLLLYAYTYINIYSHISCIFYIIMYIQYMLHTQSPQIA